jgi:multiple sugar transport system substrate-binding protein
LGEQFYKDIIYNPEYAVPEAVIAEQGFGEMMKAGKVAMFFGGAADDFDYAYTKDPSVPKLVMALVPKGPKDRTTFAWTAITGVSTQTKNPDLAKAGCLDKVSITGRYWRRASHWLMRM